MRTSLKPSASRSTTDRIAGKEIALVNLLLLRIKFSGKYEETCPVIRSQVYLTRRSGKATGLPCGDNTALIPPDRIERPLIQTQVEQAAEHEDAVRVLDDTKHVSFKKRPSFSSSFGELETAYPFP
jgi:hypothetical protein